VHTSWTSPHKGYDEALRGFVEGSLADPEFRAQVEGFVAPLVAPGRIVSLAQTLLKLTAPGVPDIYQGTELWTSTLVDPDNRRPVDYAARRQLLGELDRLTPEEIVARMDEALPKLWVIRQALALRKKRPELFGMKSDYLRLPVSGARSVHAIAFARAEKVVTVVPRLLIRLRGDWADTTVSIPAGRWRNLLSGEWSDGGPSEMAKLLGRFPVALLAREDDLTA
jgi:(1->4)-alpha-D-glucan 1-alpha-D-glucosylmutase